MARGALAGFGWIASGALHPRNDSRKHREGPKTGAEISPWRDPRAVGDSLVGRGPLPETARQAVALASIDSLRIQSTDGGKAVIVGTGVAIAALLAFTEGLNFK